MFQHHMNVFLDCWIENCNFDLLDHKCDAILEAGSQNLRDTGTMRLCRVLLKQLAPGKIDRGKNRIYPKITRGDVKKAKEAIAITERNILLLRHPYLTIKESYGHEDEVIDKEKLEFQKLLKETLKIHTEKFPDVTMEERFMRADVTHSWD
ncbi:Ribosomal protein 63 mitochondrial [Trinorchestia longiramus]|nr:Ribosomal protein 63 mitochondrial [Trinorchestia longiramus]